MPLAMWLQRRLSGLLVESKISTSIQLLPIEFAIASSFAVLLAVLIHDENCITNATMHQQQRDLTFDECG
jgi:hypothetical protein